MQPREGDNKGGTLRVAPATTVSAAKPTSASAAKPTTMTSAVKPKPSKAAREATCSVSQWTQCVGKACTGACIDVRALRKGQLALSRPWTSKTPKDNVTKEIAAILQGQRMHPSNVNKHADMLADLTIWHKMYHDARQRSADSSAMFVQPLTASMANTHNPRFSPKKVARLRYVTTVSRHSRDVPASAQSAHRP